MKSVYSFIFLVFATVVASSANSTLLYGIDTGTDSLVTVDNTTGTVNTIGGFGISWGLGGLAFQGSTLYGIDSNSDSLYTINSSTGNASLVGSTGSLGALESFAIIGGVGYTQNVFTNDLYSIDLSTGIATLIGNYSGGRVTGLTTDGTSLFGTRIFDQDLVELNIGTGGIDSIIGVHGLFSSTSLAFADTSFWTIPAFSGQLYSLNTTNANATLAFSSLPLSHLTGLTAQASVPEPTTLALFALGLAGLGLARRKKA